MVGLVWGLVYFPRDMFEPKLPVNLSSQELIEKIRQYSAFTVPDNAYDIRYYYEGFTDGWYWCAFSVGEEDLKKLEAEYAPWFAPTPVKPQISSEPGEADWPPFAPGTIPLPPQNKESAAWWPKEKGNLKSAGSEKDWIGIDPLNHRVYCYYTHGNG